MVSLALVLMLCASVIAYSADSLAGKTRLISAQTNGSVGKLSVGATTAVKANGKIAFTSSRDGNNEIYSMSPDGGNQTRLTNDPANDTVPTWSPNGTKLAFTSNRNGNVQQIFVMSADGTNPQQISSPNLSAGSISWSPDGTRLAFNAVAAQSTVSDIFVINVDGTNLIKLTKASSQFDSNFAPAWSPDGASIAFVKRSFLSSSIFIMNPDGSSQARVTEGDRPSWSPDGSAIVFSRILYDLDPPIFVVDDIFAINLSSGLEWRLTTTPQTKPQPSNFSPVWSPDGTKIAFVRTLDNSVGNVSSDIYVMDPDGSNKVLITHTGNNIAASWQPQPTGSAGCANPVDCPDFFVSQHYRDFLNREPDSPGLAYWTDTMTRCGFDQQCFEVRRINASAAFFLSIEFQQTGYLIYRMYKASYGNLPGAPVPIKLSEFLPDTQQIGKGLVVNQPGWEQTLENNKQAFASQFVQRSRFVSAYPAMVTPAQFVDALLANGGITSSATERASLIGEFNAATTSGDLAARARVLRRVAENQIFAQQEFNRAFVLMQYFGYLQRNPNDAPEPGLNFDGYNFWLSKLNQFHGNFIDAEMVRSFLVSSEYRQRFGQP
jgi:Tol biopolymer transport system component